MSRIVNRCPRIASDISGRVLTKVRPKIKRFRTSLVRSSAVDGLVLAATKGMRTCFVEQVSSKLTIRAVGARLLVRVRSVTTSNAAALSLLQISWSCCTDIATVDRKGFITVAMSERWLTCIQTSSDLSGKGFFGRLALREEVFAFVISDVLQCRFG
jgi:hypothetical protein